MKYLAALFTLILARTFAPATAWAQFSPGPLSRAHATINGSTQCTNCHVGGGGDNKFKCLVCHTDIRERLGANQGLHANVMGKNRSDDECVKCHSEHNGENSDPIRWDTTQENFDHRKTGYPLDGGHAGLACNRCHAPEHISPKARRSIVMKDLRRSYLGLSRECGSCHEDEHKGQVSSRCERCHTTSHWKDVSRFDHSTAKFRLAGAHEKVVCAKCHTAMPQLAAAKPRIRFVGLAYAQCSACHKDPHGGSFSATCSSCHTDQSWKIVRNSAAVFDHSKTKYPLEGKHSGVACNQCHRTADFKAPVAHQQCNECHKDVHGGQFLARAGGECGSCHTVDSWKPSTFTVQAHAKSDYPLLGRHAAVKCDGCHKPAGTATAYRVRFDQCADCHQDAHIGQFTNSANNSRCDDCHTVDRFRPAKFTLASHNQTRFPLDGGHVAVSCDGCHAKSPDHPESVAYRFADLSCTECHLDPHRFGGKISSAQEASGSRCEVCHTVQNWREVSKFDHSTTDFKLTGSHRGVRCDQCHRATSLSLGIQGVAFQDAPRTCAGCHEDIHAGQFIGRAESHDCDGCHNTNKWKPSLFDHNRADFQLDGAHSQVACANCHKNKQQTDGRIVLLYKPTPKECSSCHGPGISN